MGNLSKSIAGSILVQIPAQLFGIIAGIFITRMLGPSGKGLYAIFYADVSLFATIFDFGLINTIIYFSASKKASYSQILKIAYISIILTFIISIIALVAWLNTPFSYFIFPIKESKWQFGMFFILFFMISHINTVYPAIFQGVKNFKIVNRILLLNSVFTLFLYGVAFIFHLTGMINMGLNEILVIGIIILCINTFFWHIYFRKQFSYRVKFRINWNEDIKPFFKFQGLGHLALIVNFLNYRLVVWMLAYYLDESEVGIFTIAAGIGQMLYFFSTPLSQVLMPFLSSENKENRLRIFQIFARIHFSVVFFIAVIGIVIAPFAIPIVYGSSFERSVLPFMILITGAILTSQAKLFDSFLLSENKVRLNLFIALIGLFLAFILNFFFIRSYGIIGAAISQSLSAIGVFMLIYLISVVSSKVKPNLFIVTPADIKFMRSGLIKKRV